jgi:hypothetical protein
VNVLGSVVGKEVGGVDVLYLGLAIAAVIVALTLARWLKRRFSKA